jgi:FKBP-type peptidyl-prolyl cis-trans isomerase FkpA
MKPRSPILTLLLGLGLLAAGSAGPALAAAPESDDDKVFYYLGVLLSRNLGSFDLSESEAKTVAQGFRDGATDVAEDFDRTTWQPRIESFRKERFEAAVAKEKEASSAYLEKMAAEPGFEKTDSGLLIKQVEEGDGIMPDVTDIVKVHYEGKLRDGTVFDSSKQRGEPATFPLNRVIPCWTEALQHMKQGGKSEVVCPAEIAYGDRGAPPAIPGGAALTFDVELLEVIQRPNSGGPPADSPSDG